ncbi:hypothetical protein RIF29_38116 [Crotalaria pallida]|uniref:Replication protein A 70 kDa DNA-binding subunit B/D first OB fold domain-containing protein n=1 Tax=Crotalaria pallida TaxID=3830 RepID=A0AAN9E1M1_CROPI
MFEPHLAVRDINPSIDRVAFRARIISLLRVPTLGNPHSPYNMHMVLLDPFGDDIQASVYGPFVPFFSRNLHEGYVYDFASFQVVEAQGEFRLTNHAYKLIFLFSNSLERATSLNFPMWALKNNSVDAMFASEQPNTHLQDFFCMLTAVSNEGYHVIRGRRTLVRGIELCNEYGTFDCVLLGNYVHDFRIGIASSINGQNVVLLKLVKGQDVWSALLFFFFVSTVLFNPNIPEVIQFRRRMLMSGFVRSPPIVTYFGSRDSIENQLMGDFPPVTLAVLKSINKNKFVPPFPNMENLHGNVTPVQGTEAKDDDNSNICVGKGKSAFHPYQPNLKKRHLKKNLIKDYDAIFPGESSTANNFYQPNTSAITGDLSNSNPTDTFPLSK